MLFPYKAKHTMTGRPCPDGSLLPDSSCQVEVGGEASQPYFSGDNPRNKMDDFAKLSFFVWMSVSFPKTTEPRMRQDWA